MEVWWPPIKVYFTPFTNMTIRVFESFSGIGSQRLALRNLGIDNEVVATSDVDEFTVKSYAAIHDNDKVVPQVTDEEMQDYLEERNVPLNDKGVRKILKGKKSREFYEACIKSNNLGDISKVVTQDIPDHDLFTYSFPCQSISAAGKQRGFEKDSGTRSSLLWECEKVIDVKRPKYLLMENVKALVSKKFIQGFENWLELLEGYGYTNYYRVLNAKNYGIPQNRERVFVVSILGEHEPYKFPEPVELKLRLKDVLEDNVDDRYTITQPSMISKLPGKDVPGTFGGRMLTEITDFAWTITTKQMRAPNSGVVRLDENNFRYLTEKECWRLMGFDDEDFYNAKKEHPRRGNFLNGTLYHQAGNSIVVPVLEAIFKQLFKEGHA